MKYILLLLSIMTCSCGPQEPFEEQRETTRVDSSYYFKNMKRFKLILKGVLLWITAFAVMLFISGVDSIYDNGYFIHSIIMCVMLCYTCYKLISEEELEVLTFSKWFNKITGENNK